MNRARVGLALATVLAVAGCSTPSGGTAFQVDGATTSEKRIDQVTAGCMSRTKGSEQQLRPKVAQFLLVGDVARAVAHRTGTTITAAEQAQATASLGAGPLTGDPDCASMVDGLATMGVLQGKLGPQKLRAAVDQLDVKVNPSYGNWAPAQLTFDGASGSLSGLGSTVGG